MINQPTKFELSIYTHYEDIKNDTKFGVVRGHSRSLKIGQFDRVHTSSH